MLVSVLFFRGDNNMKKYFTKTEIALWSSSVFLILISFLLFDRESYLTLAASLVGVTSLIFSAKGNPFGQLLMVLFGYISPSEEARISPWHMPRMMWFL